MASDRSHPERGKQYEGNTTVTDEFPEGTGNHYVVQSAGKALSNESAALSKSGKGVDRDEVVSLEGAKQ
eukprot:7399221-Prorocentrum_lima.AAC.1